MANQLVTPAEFAREFLADFEKIRAEHPEITGEQWITGFIELAREVMFFS